MYGSAYLEGNETGGLYTHHLSEPLSLISHLSRYDTFIEDVVSITQEL
jgi:hypothetical protein